MTTGKNAAKTANRERMLAEREAPLRRRITHLEAEVSKLDRANLEQQAAYLTETRKMRMLIVQGTSEKLAAAEARVVALQGELDYARAQVEVRAEERRKIADVLMDHMMGEHDMTLSEAMQQFIEVLGMDDITVLPPNLTKETFKKLSTRGQAELLRIKRQQEAS